MPAKIRFCIKNSLWEEVIDRKAKVVTINVMEKHSFALSNKISVSLSSILESRKQNQKPIAAARTAGFLSDIQTPTLHAWLWIGGFWTICNHISLFFDWLSCFNFKSKGWNHIL